MIEELKEVWRFRELLIQLVARDLKVRYKNSVLGFFWSLANPLVQVAVITIVFKTMTGMVKVPNYSAYVLCAFIPWNYFQTAVLDSSQSILLMFPVIKKVYLPRELIPLSNAISNFIHFLLAWIVFFLYLYGYLRAPVLTTVLLLPVLVIIQFVFTLGVSLYVSCLNVFYEDIKYLVTVLLNLFFFLLPLIYFTENVYFAHSIPPKWHMLVYRLYMLNPVACLITAFRKSLLQPLPAHMFPHVLPLDYTSIEISAVFSVLVLVTGYAYFNARKWQFVEKP